MELHTERLLLRGWRPDDREPFAALNADPVAMEHFEEPLDRARSDAFADRIEAHVREHGWGLWAVEVPGVAPFIGYVGLARVGFEAQFTPAIEVQWRLLPAHWGRGYATEAARAAAGVGFGELGLGEIVSFTVPANRRSRAVMERLGMRRDPAEDFDHPRVSPGSPLRRHVLYRLRREVWPERLARDSASRCPRSGGGAEERRERRPRRDRAPQKPTPEMGCLGVEDPSAFSARPLQEGSLT